MVTKRNDPFKREEKKVQGYDIHINEASRCIGLFEMMTILENGRKF